MALKVKDPPRVLCDAGCGTEIESRSISIAESLLCELCGAQAALAILDDPAASKRTRAQAEAAVSATLAWRRLDVYRRIVRVAP